MFKIFKRKSIEKTKEKDSVFSVIIDAICSVNPEIKRETIKEESELEHLGIDSIKFMNLLISFEDILGKDIEDFVDEIDVSKLRTVNDIVILLKKIK